MIFQFVLIPYFSNRIICFYHKQIYPAVPFAQQCVKKEEPENGYVMENRLIFTCKEKELFDLPINYPGKIPG
jgi:hypothetical protein